jgi:hypothetical protein
VPRTRRVLHSRARPQRATALCRQESTISRSKGLQPAEPPVICVPPQAAAASGLPETPATGSLPSFPEDGLFRRGAAVAQRTVNPLVVGSNPTAGANLLQSQQNLLASGAVRVAAKLDCRVIPPLCAPFRRQGHSRVLDRTSGGPHDCARPRKPTCLLEPRRFESGCAAQSRAPPSSTPSVISAAVSARVYVRPGNAA